MDYNIFKPVKPVEEYKADLSFIGGRTPQRDTFKKDMERLFDAVKFYGNGYGKEVINEEFTAVCSSSTYMLSLNTFNNLKDYFSNRLLRYLGCGCCVLHYDPTESLGKYFIDCEDLILFKDIKDLESKLKRVNAGTLAINGRTKALNNYTWDHSIQKILGIIKNDGVC